MILVTLCKFSLLFDKGIKCISHVIYCHCGISSIKLTPGRVYLLVHKRTPLRRDNNSMLQLSFDWI